MTSVKSEPFRPSNGTEGEAFIAAFCCQCARSEHLQAGDDDAPVGCPILDQTFAFDSDAPEYPSEWIQEAAGARCTAFVQEGEPLAPPRCTRTEDMFGEATP